MDSNGIGMSVENILESTVVVKVKDGSSAHSKGVTPGDLLTMTGEVMTAGMYPRDVSPPPFLPPPCAL